MFSITQTLTERLGLDAVKVGVSGKSKLMEELANIDDTKEEVLRRDGKLPSANAWAEAYESDTGALPVVVTDIANIPEDISQVMIAVWTNEDQSDLQWIGMEQREDGSYYARVNVPGFGYKVGEYQIHVYVVGEDGEQYKVAETVGVVE